MNYSWYETKKLATIEIYTGKLEKEDNIDLRKTETGIHLQVNDRSTSIRIDHEFEIVNIEIHPHKVAAHLEKKEPRKWLYLEKKELQFEMQVDIPETNEEHSYSNDPITNMLMGVYNRADEKKKREMDRSFFSSNGTEIRTTPKIDEE